MNIKTYYYACLKFKDPINGIHKEKFETRKEARDYISENFDDAIHEQCWTE